ncbi:MAG: RluA family pseudouridine synthase [Cellvibrionales bacterium]|nr:RluA family pseudouridine synthase [Cellvibrionales bacterium]
MGDAAARPQVRLVEVEAAYAGQRLDNFLLRELKGAPRSLIYRILRTGQVRVNKKRARPPQRLYHGDRVRIPPLRLGTAAATLPPGPALQQRLRDSILFEDDHLLALDKPAGLAVHGGSGVAAGLIGSLRAMNLGGDYLELVHRLDRATSGCLLLAKHRRTLATLHQDLRSGQIQKSYQLLVAGPWPAAVTSVDAPLRKYRTASGEARVQVSEQGKPARTHFKVLEQFAAATLLEAKLETGRTHQIRAHAQHAGHPILGDTKYGDYHAGHHADHADVSPQSLCQKLRLNRMFLHAHRLALRHPETGQPLQIEAPLPTPLTAALTALRRPALD